MSLSGVRSHPANLFKVAGFIGSHPATLMIDSGASSEFIDSAFARRCGLELEPCTRTIRLADGALAPAHGQATLSYSLVAASGQRTAPFSAVFTSTPLKGYDAILGLSWLAEHDVIIGWQSRTIEIRKPGQLPLYLKPLAHASDSLSSLQLGTITVKALERERRRGEALELFAVYVQTEPPSAAPAAPQEPIVSVLLKEYADVFPDGLPHGLPPERGVQHRIELLPGSRPPPVRPLHHQSSKDLAVFEEYTRSMIAAGQLRVSHSPYGAMALIVRKKDGTARVVVDYRSLNELTIKNKYPLPLMDELFDRVFEAKVFSKLDLRTGFHQIRVHEDDVEKTAFRTRYGSFEYRVLPMGLCNAPGTFMQLMNDTFRDMLDRSVLVFLDDILVFSKTQEEHLLHMRAVLDRLRAAKLYAKLSKCEFFRSEVEFLGHHIGANGLSVMQDKIAAVRDWPTPRCVTDIRAFLGLAGFYRRFVRRFSELALPLTLLTKTKTGAPFDWGPSQASAFAALKAALTSAPVLIIADPSLPYTLNCDACNYAIGATLQQDHGQGLQPVAFMSRKLKPAEINYDTREKEFLALVDACRHWRQYLHSELPFKLLSDHDSLKYHKTMPHISGRIARWIERMSEFHYDIEHIAGEKNVVADALSRRADLRDPSPADALAAVSLRPRGINSAVADEAARIHNRAAAELVRPRPAGVQPPPDSQGVVRMPSQRCTADTKGGGHCRARTAMGQYCWNHLRAIRGLRIKASAVAGGGRALFAARALPADFRIDYTGDRVALDGTNGGSYFLELSRTQGIDAARTNAGEGRWLNDPRGSGLRANCEFRIYTPPGQPRIGCVRTTRSIAAGEELTIAYGAKYWRFHAAAPAGMKQVRQRADAADRAAAAQPAALATLDTADAPLAGAILAAALADATYAELLAAPPSGTAVHSGLLWDSGGSILYVPNNSALRTSILAHCHDAPTGAHFGRDKTLHALQQRFRWEGLATDADSYVRTCDACQRNKPSQRRTPGALMPLPLPDAPCQEWTTDAVTGLPRTLRGHDSIQGFVERLCKVKHFVAARKSDGAKEAAAHFVHAVVRPHGVRSRSAATATRATPRTTTLSSRVCWVSICA